MEVVARCFIITIPSSNSKQVKTCITRKHGFEILIKHSSNKYQNECFGSLRSKISVKHICYYSWSDDCTMHIRDHDSFPPLPLIGGQLEDDVRILREKVLWQRTFYNEKQFFCYHSIVN